MLIQEVDWTRFLMIFSVQLFIIIFFLFLGIFLLKRNRNRLNLNLSIYYFLISFGFLIITISLPIRINPLVYILYFISIYLVIVSQVFIIFFSLNLLTKDKPFSLKTEIILIISYSIVTFIVLYIPNGIYIGEITNWKPVYSWEFLIIIYLYLTFAIYIPEIYLSLRLLKKFSDERLKKKLKLFICGTFTIFSISYGTILYNTWNNEIYKIIYTFISFLIIPAGFLIFYGIGKDL